jgi:hypothetical protein
MPRDVKPGDEPGNHAAKRMGAGMIIGAVVAVILVALAFYLLRRG